MSGQLAFDLPVREARGRGDFMVAPANALALAALDGWRDWPDGRMVLTGPPGSGKSHLAQVWAGAAGAEVVAAAALATADLPALAACGAVVVEDADRVAGDRGGQVALFHLHNMLGVAGGALLVTAGGPPRDWGLTLPDLASRMMAAPLSRLSPPDDQLLAAVILKLFKDRQVEVSPAVILWLLPRIERSFAAARAVVAHLDARALAEGRAITRNFVMEAMAARIEGGHAPGYGDEKDHFS